MSRSGGRCGSARPPSRLLARPLRCLQGLWCAAAHLCSHTPPQALAKRLDALEEDNHREDDFGAGSDDEEFVLPGSDEGESLKLMLPLRVLLCMPCASRVPAMRWIGRPYSSACHPFQCCCRCCSCRCRCRCSRRTLTRPPLLARR